MLHYLGGYPDSPIRANMPHLMDKHALLYQNDTVGPK